MKKIKKINKICLILIILGLGISIFKVTNTIRRGNRISIDKGMKCTCTSAKSHAIKYAYLRCQDCTCKTLSCDQYCSIFNKSGIVYRARDCANINKPISLAWPQADDKIFQI